MSYLFLALIFFSASPIIGVQIEPGAVSTAMPYLAFSSPVKYRINWNHVDALGWSGIDTDLAYVEGHDLLLTIHNAPARYRSVDWECGDVTVAGELDFFLFIREVVLRYNPKWIEIWNEPDNPYSEFSHLFGCWSSGDAYWQMVSRLYPRLKAEFPDLIVVCGAMNRADDFLPSTPNLCDAISIHVYPTYSQGVGGFWQAASDIALLHQLGWNHVYVTETSLLDDPVGELQADYFESLTQSNVEAFWWYTLSGNEWRNSDLVENGTYRPAWYEYWKVSR